MGLECSCWRRNCCVFLPRSWSLGHALCDITCHLVCVPKIYTVIHAALSPTPGVRMLTLSLDVLQVLCSQIRWYNLLKPCAHTYCRSAENWLGFGPTFTCVCALKACCCWLPTCLSHRRQQSAWMSLSHFGHKAAGVNPLKLHAHTCSRSARDWLKLQPCLHWLVHGLRACSFGLIPTVSTQRVRLLRQDHILPFVSFDSGVLWWTWTLSYTHPKLWPRPH